MKKLIKVLIGLLIVVLLLLSGTYLYRFFSTSDNNVTDDDIAEVDGELINNNDNNNTENNVDDNVVDDGSKDKKTIVTETTPITTKTTIVYRHVKTTADDVTADLIIDAGSYEGGVTFSIPSDYANTKGFILPGDKLDPIVETIDIAHDRDSKLCFRLEPHDDRNDANNPEKLSDIMDIKITIEGSGVVFDGKIGEAKNFSFDSYVPKDIASVKYTFEISMPTSAGNEYQNSEFLLDLIWTVPEEYIDTLVPYEIPVTGISGFISNMNSFDMVKAACMVTAVALVIVMFKTRKKTADEK